MPTKSEEITSFINKAITMATKGGKIDIHSGIGPDTGPKAYISNMPNKMIMSTPNPIFFDFIKQKYAQKYIFFDKISL